jgi:hypothetical protein
MLSGFSGIEAADRGADHTNFQANRLWTKLATNERMKQLCSDFV